jgi:hypothetical protein
VSKPSDPSPSGAKAPRSGVWRYVAAFGHFWWEFLVGDTPELLAGAVVVVAVGALLAHHGAARVLTVAAMPVLVIAVLGASVRRAQRAARTARPPKP